MSQASFAWMLAAGALLAGCGGDTSSKVAAPGEEAATKTKLLESGAAVLQRKAPLDALNAYLDGFHFYNGDMQAQMEAHHYCGYANEDVIQCVIFDGNKDDAKIMGVEYIVTRKLFVALPPEEKHLWHSHAYEVRSGSLVAPGIPEIVERELMTKIAGTYGKTWHTWHTDREHSLPLGIPSLMMGFTADGQANEQMIAERDGRMSLSSGELKQRRAEIEYPPIDPDADAWSNGIVMQLHLQQRAN